MKSLTRAFAFLTDCNYHLTLKMASAQVGKTSATNNSPTQDSSHPDGHFHSRNTVTILEEVNSLYGLIFSGDVKVASSVRTDIWHQMLSFIQLIDSDLHQVIAITCWYSFNLRLHSFDVFLILLFFSKHSLLLQHLLLVSIQFIYEWGLKAEECRSSHFLYAYLSKLIYWMESFSVRTHIVLCYSELIFETRKTKCCN